MSQGVHASKRHVSKISWTLLAPTGPVSARASSKNQRYDGDRKNRRWLRDFTSPYNASGPKSCWHGVGANKLAIAMPLQDRLIAARCREDVAIRSAGDGVQAREPGSRE